MGQAGAAMVEERLERKANYLSASLNQWRIGFCDGHS